MYFPLTFILSPLGERNDLRQPTKIQFRILAGTPTRGKRQLLRCTMRSVRSVNGANLNDNRSRSL